MCPNLDKRTHGGQKDAIGNASDERMERALRQPGETHITVKGELDIGEPIKLEASQSYAFCLDRSPPYVCFVPSGGFPCALSNHRLYIKLAKTISLNSDRISDPIIHLT